MWKLENDELPDSITSKYQRISHNYNTRQSKQSKIQIPSAGLPLCHKIKKWIFCNFVIKCHKN